MTTWPHDTPGAGPLSERDLELAIFRSWPANFGRRAEDRVSAELRERFPECDGSCEDGRSQCACQPATDAAAKRREASAPKPLTRKESVQFWAIASAPAIALLGVAGFYILTRFGHVFWP